MGRREYIKFHLSRDHRLDDDLATIVRPAWMKDGACRESDVNFFPERGEPTEEAKAICLGECVVQEQCLEFGLGERHGIWGGTSERERRRIRKRRAE